MIERIFPYNGGSKSEELESTGKCPSCGEFDGLVSKLKEVDGDLVFEKSACLYCDYNV